MYDKKITIEICKPVFAMLSFHFALSTDDFSQFSLYTLPSIEAQDYRLSFLW